MQALPAALAALLSVLPVAVLALTPTSPPLLDAPVPTLDWQVVSRRAHDTGAFTQGLQLDDQGRLFESTGRYGTSTLREVDAATGRVLRRLELPAQWFGEGLASVGDDLVQLTWKEGIATRRDADTFELLDTYAYEGEGWGICFDGRRFVMSDGSDQLTFRDAGTFEVIGSVAVSLDGTALPQLNELECVDGSVWANVWLSDDIVRIDPSSGRVTGRLDLSGIIEPHPQETDSDAVLNGIAWDASANTFLVTGKRWPELVEIRLIKPES
jgi:glutaminyl-peptide cyclotransferase